MDSYRCVRGDLLGQLTLIIMAAGDLGMLIVWLSPNPKVGGRKADYRTVSSKLEA